MSSSEKRYKARWCQILIREVNGNIFSIKVLHFQRWHEFYYMALVPCLQGRGLGTHDLNAVCSNAERLLILCLFENDDVHRMVIEFARDCQAEGSANESVRQIIFRVAQLITSIPDKARARAPTSLSSPFFFKHVTTQILAGAEEWDKNLDETAYFDKNRADGAMLFIGEAFARICRRGFADNGGRVQQMLKHIGYYGSCSIRFICRKHQLDGFSTLLFLNVHHLLLLWLQKPVMFVLLWIRCNTSLQYGPKHNLFNHPPLSSKHT